MDNAVTRPGLKFGFIGVGNMGGALARAVRRNVPGDHLTLANRTRERAETLAEELGCAAGASIGVAEWADFLFLGVKPQVMRDLLSEIGPVLAKRRNRFVLVTMAAGMTIARIQELAGGEYPVIRIMPNTPAAFGEGMTLYTRGTGVTEEEEGQFLTAMAGAGQFSPLPEPFLWISLLSHWPMAAWPAACPGARRWSLPFKQCWVPPGWSRGPDSIPAR